MNLPAIDPIAQQASLVAIVDRASTALAGARSSAEVLEARDMASFAYDIAKRTARLAKAKDAADTLVMAAYRLQASALEIEAQAKRRLADEYDAAQERGEIRTQADNQAFSKTEKAGGADIDLTPKDIHEARLIRDAEVADPGVVKRTLYQLAKDGHEPSRAALREAVMDAVKRGGRSPARSRSNPLYEPPTEAEAAWQHVYGMCRAFAEWATDENIDLAMRGRNEAETKYGLRDGDDRAVREGLARLTKIVETIDA